MATEVDILDAGFGCKDLSTLNTDHLAWTEYVIKMLDAVNMHMELPPEHEANVDGTMLPTLFGCLRCIYVCKPLLVWLENVEGVKKIWPKICQLMSRWVTLET